MCGQGVDRQQFFEELPHGELDAVTFFHAADQSTRVSESAPSSRSGSRGGTASGASRSSSPTSPHNDRVNASSDGRSCAASRSPRPRH